MSGNIDDKKNEKLAVNVRTEMRNIPSIRMELPRGGTRQREW